MNKLQKRILQALALSLLLLIQFLSIQAEREDFAPNTPKGIHCITHTVIGKRVQYAYQSHAHRHHGKHKQHHKRKIQSVKHITLKFSTPEKPAITTTPGFYNNTHHFSYSEQYSYTYFKDINPPPPKA